MRRGIIRLVIPCFIALIPAGMAVAQEAKPDVEILRDVVYAQVGDESLAADVYVPAGVGPFPGVLVVHGGAWATGRRTQLSGVARVLAQRGYTAVAISYRLAPKFPFPAQIEDCRTAVRWMRGEAEKYKIDPKRIGGLGYSAGGHLVALLGAEDDTAKDGETSSRLQAVAAGGAPYDFRKWPSGDDNRSLAYWLGGTRGEKPKNYELASPAVFVTKDDPPMFIFHGEEDPLVPLASGESMTALLKATGVPVEFYISKGAGHIGAMFDRAAVGAALAFLDKVLKPEK